MAAGETRQGIQFVEVKLRDMAEQPLHARGNGQGLHVTYVRSHDERSSVNVELASPHGDSDIRRVSAAPLPDPTSPQAIAARIRARLAELELSESSFAAAEGKDRTTLSTQLRRLASGGNLRQDTLIRLSKYLGKPIHWILTGEDILGGIPLSQMEGWNAAVVEVLTRFQFTPEQIEAAGRICLPERRRLDALAVAGFVQANIASRPPQT